MSSPFETWFWRLYLQKINIISYLQRIHVNGIFIYMNMDSWLLWQVNSPQKRNKQQTLSIPLHIAGFNHQALRMTVLTALTVSLQHNSETGSNPSFWANCYNSKIPKSECFWHVGDTGWRLGVEMSEHSHWSSCRSADDAPWHSCFCHQSDRNFLHWVAAELVPGEDLGTHVSHARGFLQLREYAGLGLSQHLFCPLAQSQ